MSNTHWGEDVKVAILRQHTTQVEVAEKAGINYQMLSSLINGRCTSRNYAAMAEKVNMILGTSGIPPYPKAASDEWCGEVRKMLQIKRMKINDLANAIGFTRDKVSLVINGKLYDEAIIDKVNEYLVIAIPAISDN